MSGIGENNNGKDVSQGNSCNNTDRSPQQREQEQQREQDQEQQRAQQQQQQQQQMLISTNAFDNLLTREMMQLSLKARNDIQEEIHGVKCLVPLETPQLLLSSLQNLEAELERVVPSETTNSFLLAKGMGEESYANTVEFKLRFLRKYFFNAQKAAACLCEYLYRIHSIFGGLFALKREIHLHQDFTKEELREFRKGRYQLLPFRDRSGRRILVVFPGDEIDQMRPQLRAKFICYLSTVATIDDIETQRNGIVILVWFHDVKYNISAHIHTQRSPLQNYETWGSVRVCAFHICSPDTPTFQFRRSIVALRAGQKHRTRIQFHLGDVELLYNLQSYGIPTENIPITWSGTIKIVYLKNWMKLRKAIEDDYEIQRQIHQQHQREGLAGLPLSSIRNVSKMTDVVECPNTNDVVFRQGTSLYCHPGNGRFRSLVESKVIQLRNSLLNDDRKFGQDNRINSNINVNNIIKSNDASSPISTLISEIIDHIINIDEGRVLVWTPNHNNKKYGCWCTITNEEQIYSKIEYTVREHIRGGGSSVATGATTTMTTQTSTLSRAEKQKSNLQPNESSTSIFPPSVLSIATSTTFLPGSSSSKRAKISSTSNSSEASSSDDDSCNFFCR